MQWSSCVLRPGDKKRERFQGRNIDCPWIKCPVYQSIESIYALFRRPTSLSERQSDNATSTRKFISCRFRDEVEGTLSYPVPTIRSKNILIGILPPSSCSSSCRNLSWTIDRIQPLYERVSNYLKFVELVNI